MPRALLLLLALATPAWADPQAEVMARLEQADALIRAADLAGAAAQIDAAAGLAGDDLGLRYAVASERATLLAYRGEFGAAAAALVAFAPALREHPRAPAEFWLHNLLLMLHVARGDVPAALAACDEMTAAGRRGTWGPAERREQLVLLKEHWHRAYLLRMRAEQLRGAKRAATLRAAEAARAAYNKAAPQPEYRDAVAVLDGYFATLGGDRQAALAAARRVDLEENGDVEDLYLAALAFEAGGDAASARRARDKIRAAQAVVPAVAVMRAFIERDAAGGRFTPRYPKRKP
jgi:hypothetical protein